MTDTASHEKQRLPPFTQFWQSVESATVLKRKAAEAIPPISNYLRIVESRTRSPLLAGRTSPVNSVHSLNSPVVKLNSPGGMLSSPQLSSVHSPQLHQGQVKSPRSGYNYKFHPYVPYTGANQAKARSYRSNVDSSSVILDPERLRMQLHMINHRMQSPSAYYASPYAHPKPYKPKAALPPPLQRVAFAPSVSFSPPLTPPKHTKCTTCKIYYPTTQSPTTQCYTCRNAPQQQKYECNKCKTNHTSKWYNDHFQPGKICKSCYTKRRRSSSFDGIEGTRKCNSCKSEDTERWYQDEFQFVGFICTKCHVERKERAQMY